MKSLNVNCVQLKSEQGRQRICAESEAERDDDDDVDSDVRMKMEQQATRLHSEVTVDCACCLCVFLTCEQLCRFSVRLIHRLPDKFSCFSVC